jgi:hypothetical protein
MKTRNGCAQKKSLVRIGARRHPFASQRERTQEKSNLDFGLVEFRL